MSVPAIPRRIRRPHGYSIVEFLLTTMIILIVMSAVLSTNLFGLQLFELTKAKLGASDDARTAISRMIEEIRGAKLLRIGDGDLASFNEVDLNTPQRGSAIQVYPTTDTNAFVRYYWDTDDHQLKRTTNGSSYVSIVANYITNSSVFTAEDYAGNVLTNNENNRVIGLTMVFYQLLYPSATIGEGGLFDYYQLRTKITRRTLE
jgi:type II secretory pathway pseudopilin PulG